MGKIWGLNYINMLAAITFCAIGIYLGRPVIVIVSLSIIALGIWSRSKISYISSPELIMWNKYIKAHPDLKREKYITWHYGRDEESCEKWLKKVREKKIFGASYFAAAFPYESNPAPVKGQYSILLDWWGKPQLIIQTVSTESVPLKIITAELVKMEGFNDIVQWKKVHVDEYKNIARKIDVDFSDELPIMFERFQVVYDWIDEN